jgi:hypothetical protein
MVTVFLLQSWREQATMVTVLLLHQFYEREISKHGHCPSPSVLRGNQASSSTASGSKIRWLSLSQKHKRLAGWLVVRKGASSADAHIGIDHHRCACLLVCCMDLLLLLYLHCFFCIPRISYCHESTKFFSHNLFSSSLVPAYNFRQ